MPADAAANELPLNGADAAAPRWRAQPENQVTLATTAALLLVLLVCWSTVRAIERFVAASKWESHTYSVIATLDQARSAMSELVASVRGYVVTGNNAFINQRDEAISGLESSLQDLKLQVVDNPDQQRRAARLETLIGEDRTSLDAVMVARQTQGFEVASNLVAQRVRMPRVTEIRSLLSTMQAAEKTLLAERERRTQTESRNLILYGSLLVLCGVAAVAGGLWRLRRELRHRQTLLKRVEVNEQFLDSVFEHIPSMLFVKDAASLRYVRLNKAGERLLGSQRDQVLGKNAVDIYPAAEAEQFMRADRQVIDSGEVLDLPPQIYQTGLGPRTVHTRKLVINDRQGQPAFLLGICDDITERVANEQRIRELNVQLERQKTELESSNKDLESFSYSVSHDLRAPLRAVDSFALMLEEDFGPQLDPEARRYISVIREGAQKMGCLIDDLLAFSRFGRLNLRFAPVNMTALANSVAKDLLATSSEQPPQLIIQELPSGHGDASVLGQVWSNLISNAIKYSSKREQPKIEVSGEISGAEVVYHVRDNGAGFDMRYYNKLFGVFQRLHRAEEFGGTGVGLAIVHRIITRHGGRVWAEGTPDVGAQFHFTLPVGEPA